MQRCASLIIVELSRIVKLDGHRMYGMNISGD